MATAPTSAKEQFDRQAAQYNERWAAWSDETLRRMLEFADPQAGWQVLDVATGTGFTALAFAPQVASVIGADIAPGMLAEAAKRATAQGIENVSWVEAPAESLPFPDRSFDLVTVRIAPHHFTDVAAFLRETYRVLRPGGVFVLGDTTVPDNDREAAEWQNRVEYVRDNSHVRNLAPQEWRFLGEAAGFTLTNLEYREAAIEIPLEAWLETAGCTGERAAEVRRLFAEAPPSARRHFHIVTAPATGGTHFAWPRVLLRTVRP
jgi:ubiquinone/menaquinone biosynthesis C-methylase UbiE